MTAPALVAQRLLTAAILGAFTGLIFSFLKPLAEMHPVVSDLLFLPALYLAWIYLGFSVCQGDLRLGYTLGLLAGWGLWEITLGRVISPVFGTFWKVFGKIFHFLLFPVKKFLKKRNIGLKIKRCCATL